ncbi:hypothetical protein KI387_020894, partial [Taxus chinensis]
GRFEQWVSEHGKTYNNYHEKQNRLDIFNERNKQYLSYVLGLKEFSDLSHEEFKNMSVGRITPGPKNTSIRYTYPQVDENLPSSVDWRKQRAVTPVKMQGQGCGDCWAFSTVASVEAINKIVTGKLISLSEQQLDACVKENHGCSAGTEGAGFNYIISNDGIATEADYPYTGGRGVCNKTLERKHAVTINGYINVPSRDEKSMKTFVAQQPVSADIDASGRDWSAYKSGIFSGKCGTRVNHGVTIIGYGSEHGMDYWIVKVSWGRKWGEGGCVEMWKIELDSVGLPYM